MNGIDPRITEKLIEDACPSIQARVIKEVLRLDPEDTEESTRQALIMQDKLVKEVMSWAGATGWLDSSFHGSKGIETAIRILSEKGVRKDHPLITTALTALEKNPGIIYRGIGAPGKILDDLGFGGSRLIKAVVWAQAGNQTGLDEQLQNALAAFRFVTTVDHIDAITSTFKNKTVFSHDIIWPSIYHLRLLAFTDIWRSPENIEMMQKAVEKLADLSPIPAIKVLWRSQLIAPASFAMLDFNPDLEGMSGAAWMAWFHRTELISRVGVMQAVPALRRQLSQLNAMLEAGKGWFAHEVYHRSFFSWGTYTGLSLENDWRSKRRRICDLTFRSLLIRRFASVARGDV